MPSCNDCLHVDVCCSYLSVAYNKCKLATPDFKLLKNIECGECQHFKDRSRFVELPCKIGDIVYFGYYLPTIKQYKIDEWIVAKISFINYHLGYFFDSDGKWAVGDKENRIAITLVLSDKSEFSPDSIDVPLKDFRDKFFTSREAAEQAVKECGK